ncbi:hypothetical protein BDZ89DRAFT_1068330, partial [Hymenopellis radicata]
MSSFSDLPVDVARYILEIAARSTVSMPACICIEAVREWIDPILYHTVVLRPRRCGPAPSLRRIMQGPYCQRCGFLCSERESTLHTREHKLSCHRIHTHALHWSRSIGGVVLHGRWNTISREPSWVHERQTPLACRRGLPSSSRLYLSQCHASKPAARPSVEDWIDWEDLFRCCPYLTHILFDRDGDHAWNWNSELLAEGTVSKFRDVLKAAPPSFKALIFEILESGDA